MRQLSDYNVYIFDCDGVVLDSNQLKIDAMESALSAFFQDRNKITECINYFRYNFGRSRFHHVDVFVDDIFCLSKHDAEAKKNDIIEFYSQQCKSLYLSAELTPGFIDFITRLNGKKYVASGSEQTELREVFQLRGLSPYFVGIYGSPMLKTELVANILKQEDSADAVMFGDALSDLSAARDNNIDFIAYLPFSNVEMQLTAEAKKHNFKQCVSWSDIC